MANAKRSVARKRSVSAELDLRHAASQRSPAMPAELPVRGGYLPHVLSRLMNLLNLQLLKYLRMRKLTIGQFRVLQFIEQFDGATINEISSDCVIEQSVVSRIVDQLEHRRLVTRKKNRSNARYVQVFMTATGRATIFELDTAAKKIATHAASELSSSEHEQLVSLLQRVFHKINESAQTRLG
jgi:DNA-binding MarR family transcriptional regulator